MCYHVRMKISQWKKNNKKTLRELAEMFGVTISTVERWCKKEVKPSPDKMKEVHAKTGGEVTYKDWYEG